MGALLLVLLYLLFAYIISTPDVKDESKTSFLVVFVAVTGLTLLFTIV